MALIEAELVDEETIEAEMIPGEVGGGFILVADDPGPTPEPLPLPLLPAPVRPVGRLIL